MAYRDLYQLIQTVTPPIPRKFIVENAVKFSTSQGVSTIMSGLDTTRGSGYFLSSAKTDHPFVIQAKGRDVIVVARGLNRCWQRFVIFKEAMHLFDADLEKLNGSTEFNALLDEFQNPLLQRSVHMNSEINALWMAIGLTCPEAIRAEMQQRRDQKALTDKDIAKALLIPEQYVPSLFFPQYREIVNHFLSIK